MNDCQDPKVLRKACHELFVQFCDELIKILDDKMLLIAARVYINKITDMDMVLRNLYRALSADNHAMKTAGLQHTDDFFEKGNMFAFEDTEDTMGIGKYFNSIWADDTKLKPEDKETIWKWFETFINLVYKYQTVTQKQEN